MVSKQSHVPIIFIQEAYIKRVCKEFANEVPNHLNISTDIIEDDDTHTQVIVTHHVGNIKDAQVNGTI